MTHDDDFKNLVRARMTKTGESYTTARSRLRSQLSSDERWSRQVLEVAAAHYDCSVGDLVGPSRRRDLVTTRQIVMYVLHEHGKLSPEEVGRLLGGRSADTVRHAVDKLVAYQRDPSVARQLNILQDGAGPPPRLSPRREASVDERLDAAELALKPRLDKTRQARSDALASLALRVADGKVTRPIPEDLRALWREVLEAERAARAPDADEDLKRRARQLGHQFGEATAAETRARPFAPAAYLAECADHDLDVVLAARRLCRATLSRNPRDPVAAEAVHILTDAAAELI